MPREGQPPVAVARFSGEVFRTGGVLALLAAFSLFLAGIEILTLGVSLAGARITRPLALIATLVSLAVAAGYLVRLRRGAALPRRRPAGMIAIAFLVITVLLYLALWFLASTLPDFSYDGNYYHSPTIHFWMLQGRVHWIEADPSTHWGPIVTYAWNGYPKAIEVIGFLFLKACACSRLLNAVNLIFVPLGALAIISLALTLGAPAGFALGAGCLFLYMPINLAQSLTGMVDTASASCYLAFFALLIATARRLDRGQSPLPLCLGLGAALAMAAGSKGTGLFLVVAGVLVMAARVVIARRKSARLAGSGFPFSPPSRSAVFALAAVFLIALVVGGFWTARDWIRTGNPLYPLRVAVAGRVIFPGVDISRQFRPPYREGTKDWNQAERVLANWVSCLRPGEEGNYVYDSRRGGLGFAWLLSIPAVLWLLLARWRKGRNGTVTPPAAYLPDLFFVCLVMFFALPPGHNHMSRYTIWLAGLGLPCLAAATGALVSSSRGKNRRRFVGYAWFGAAGLLAAAEALVSLGIHAGFIDRFRGRETAAFAPVAVLRAARAPYPAGYRWADFTGSIFEMIMAGDETTAVAIKEKNQRHLIFGHLVQGPALGKREIVFIDHIRAEDEPGYLSLLIRERSIRYVIWDSTLPSYPGTGK